MTTNVPRFQIATSTDQKVKFESAEELKDWYSNLVDTNFEHAKKFATDLEVLYLAKRKFHEAFADFETSHRDLFWFGPIKDDEERFLFESPSPNHKRQRKSK